MIENHVVNLELSKRLKELGLNKPSLFYWIYDEKNEKWDLWFTDDSPDENNQYNYIAAYVATELLNELPENLYINQEENKCDALAKMWIYLKENELLKA